MQKASWSQTSVTVDLVLKTSFCKEDAFPVLHVEQIKVLMKSNKEVRLNDTGDWRKLTQKLWSLHRCLSHAEVWDYDLQAQSPPSVLYPQSLDMEGVAGSKGGPRLSPIFTLTFKDTPMYDWQPKSFHLPVAASEFWLVNCTDSLAWPPLSFCFTSWLASSLEPRTSVAHSTVPKLHFSSLHFSLGLCQIFLSCAMDLVHSFPSSLLSDKHIHLPYSTFQAVSYSSSSCSLVQHLVHIIYPTC